MGTAEATQWLATGRESTESPDQSSLSPEFLGGVLITDIPKYLLLCQAAALMEFIKLVDLDELSRSINTKEDCATED